MAAAAAVTSTYMAAAAASVHRLPGTRPAAASCPMPLRPSLSSAPFRISRGSRRFSQVLVKASSSDESPLDVNEFFTNLKEKWDAIENKSTVILYGGGAIGAIWLAFVFVGTIDSIPLLPNLMKLVGLGYTTWFVYRYLLLKSSRKELMMDIEEMKKKIAGTE